MIKKIISIIFCLLICYGCSIKDNKKFKDEYESYNDKKVSDTNSQRSVNIDEDNPFIYSSTEEIIKHIENKETLFIYFGDKQCPWCRSVIEKAIESAKNNGIDKIYYISIWDDNHNEILRDKYIINDDNELELVVPTSDNYKKLLTIFDDYLEEYTLTDLNGKNVNVNEKRIFAPNFVYVEGGKTKKIVTGISDKQENAYSELTEEILDDELSIFNEFFKVNSFYCNDAC